MFRFSIVDGILFVAAGLALGWLLKSQSSHSELADQRATSVPCKPSHHPAVTSSAKRIEHERFSKFRLN